MERTGRISTAMVVAAGMLLEAAPADTEQRLPALLARACLADCGHPGQRLQRLLDSRCGRTLLRCAQALTLPGIAAHYRWRKHHIRVWTREHIDAGARQLIVLGAGFDALAAGLVLTDPRLRAIEIDLPIHHQVKRRALQRLGLDHPRLRLLEADLESQSLPVLLADADGFDGDAPSIVVAEGLLMYLSPPSLQALFGDLAASLSAPASIIATAMEADADALPRFRAQRPWLRRWLRQRGEPFLWGCRAEALPDALRGLGLRIDAVADPDHPHAPDPCPGEWLFRATLAARSVNTNRRSPSPSRSDP